MHYYQNERMTKYINSSSACMVLYLLKHVVILMRKLCGHAFIY